MYEAADQGIGANEAFARARSRIADTPAWAVHRGGLEDRGHWEQAQPRDERSPPYAWVIRHLLQKGQVSSARRVLEVALATAPHLEALRSLARALQPPAVQQSTTPPQYQSSPLSLVRQAAALHKGKWVAVAGSEVVATADSLPRLMAELASRTLPVRPIIHREPS
jgi:hypothetical protein